MAGRRQDEESAQIFIESSGFEPANLNIPTGTTVTWTNHDGMAHTVFNTDKVFISEMLDTGEEYSFVFHKAGTYPYHCSIHSKMTGTINVK
ncbi:MAG TPA: cupredoxin domain-containing protein [Candidatus Saccharimonadales bacterium]|nr:cupredoxin domain-containing protein [Candidatus Saccharimonadales bacterium]